MKPAGLNGVSKGKQDIVKEKGQASRRRIRKGFGGLQTKKKTPKKTKQTQTHRNRIRLRFGGTRYGGVGMLRKARWQASFELTFIAELRSI